MVKALIKGVARAPMLISEFARATGLSRDTVRFYVRRGLLKPLAGNKGGATPYQVFTDEHVQTARAIRMAQSLGFSLREIAVLNVEYQAKRITPERGAEIMRAQLERLEEKAAHVGGMISYIHAKLAWLEAGGKGPEPNFTVYETKARAEGHKSRVPERKPGGGAPAVARRTSRNGASAAKVPAG
jgi:DNA-binding transcriptional MerR regulator